MNLIELQSLYEQIELEVKIWGLDYFLMGIFVRNYGFKYIMLRGITIGNLENGFYVLSSLIGIPFTILMHHCHDEPDIEIYIELLI